MARPGAGKQGVVFPSFLPFFETKILSSGRSAGGGSGALRCAVSRRGAGGARGLRAQGPRQAAALARDGGRARRISCLRPSRSGAGRPGLQGRGCGWRCGGRAESESGGSLPGWRTAAAPLARPRATPGRAGLRGGPFPPGRLRARGPAPRRHALPDRAPGGRPLAVGAGPSSSPPGRGPAAAEVSRGPGPRASDAPARVSPAARPTQKVSDALRPPARAPAPAIFVHRQLPSERGETERKGGGRGAGTRLLPARLTSERGRRGLLPCCARLAPGLAAAAAASAVTSPEPIEIFCVASPPFV